MEVIRYNIADFETISKSPEFIYTESTDVVNTIAYLEKIITDSAEEYYPQKNISTKPYKNMYPSQHPHPSQKKHFQHQSQYIVKKNIARNNNNSISSANTNSKIAFNKKTPHHAEGIEKDINEIRMILNKMSDTNFESQKAVIICKIDDIISKDETQNTDEHIKKVAKFVFDVACSNKFFAELYAKLYKELSNKFYIFTVVLDDFTNKYKQSIKDIVFIDPDVDYDSFCEYTKNNDKRRATAMFIIMLVKNKSLTAEMSIDLILYFIELFKEFVVGEEKNNEVDELTELVFIFMTNGKDFLKEMPEWHKNIKTFIFDYSGYKPFELESLSSRTSFKIKDLKLIYE
jgi:hypothetical protein